MELPKQFSPVPEMDPDDIYRYGEEGNNAMNGAPDDFSAAMLDDMDQHDMQGIENGNDLENADSPNFETAVHAGIADDINLDDQNEKPELRTEPSPAGQITPSNPPQPLDNASPQEVPAPSVANTAPGEGQKSDKVPSSLGGSYAENNFVESVDRTDIGPIQEPTDAAEQLTEGKHSEDTSTNAERVAASANADTLSMGASATQHARVEREPISQQHTIVIPSYASWFSMRRISDVERESLPEFFSGRNRSKTPQVYGKYRNFMINAYRMNPTEYLTVTACRRSLVGDAACIMRVHHFLDEWGLINYQVDAESRPASVAPPFTGHWQMKYDTPRGIFPFQLYEGMRDPALQPIKPGSTKQDRASGPLNDFSGFDGAGADNSDPSTSGANFNHAANDGNSSVNPADMETEGDKEEEDLNGDGTPGWSLEETRDLLEAIERYPHDWDAVAGVLGKEKPDVVKKFVQLTTENKYVEENLGPLKYNTNHIPFSRAENPVLSVLVFLASTADPELVDAALGRTRSTAAKATIKALEEAQLAEAEKETVREVEKDTVEETAAEPDEKKPHIPGEEPASEQAQNAVNTDENAQDEALPLKQAIGIDNETKETTETPHESVSLPEDLRDEKMRDHDEEEQLTTPEKKSAKQPSEASEPGVDSAEAKEDRAAEAAKVAGAATIALASARAQAFSSHTEKYIYQRYLRLLELEMSSIKLRLAKFTMMERALDTERREMDKERELLFLDRMHYRNNVAEAQSLIQEASFAAASGDSAKLAHIADLLKRRGAPEPPNRPVFVRPADSDSQRPQSQGTIEVGDDDGVENRKFSSESAAATTATSSDTGDAAPNSVRGNAFRMWTLQPRAAPTFDK